MTARCFDAAITQTQSALNHLLSFSTDQPNSDSEVDPIATLLEISADLEIDLQPEADPSNDSLRSVQSFFV